MLKKKYLLPLIILLVLIVASSTFVFGNAHKYFTEVEQAAGGDLADYITSLGTDYAETVSEKLNTVKIIKSNTMASAIQAVFAVFGVAMVVLNFSTGLLSETEKGELSTHQIGMLLVKFAFSLVVVLNIGAILDGIDTVGASLVNQVHNAITGYEDATKTTFLEGIADCVSKIANDPVKSITDFFTGKSILDGVAEIGYAKWAQLMIDMALDGVVYTIGLLFVIFKCVAPLAVASICTDGAHSSGLIFLRNYFALYIESALMYIICEIGMQIIYYAGTQGGGDVILISSIKTCYSMSVAKGAVVAMIIAAAPLSKKIAGNTFG